LVQTLKVLKTFRVSLVLWFYLLEKCGDACQYPIEFDDGFDDGFSGALDIAHADVDIILRQVGIGRCDVEQFRHQIDESRYEGKNNQQPDHDGDDDPYRGDRRPARHISVVAEGCDVDQHN